MVTEYITPCKDLLINPHIYIYIYILCRNLLKMLAGSSRDLPGNIKSSTGPEDHRHASGAPGRDKGPESILTPDKLVPSYLVSLSNNPKRVLPKKKHTLLRLSSSSAVS